MSVSEKHYDVICEVSARHYHPSVDDGSYSKKADLSQKDHWVANEKVEAHGLSFSVVMPPRKEELYELSMTDWLTYIDKEPQFEKGTFQVKLRHFHCDEETAQEWSLKDGDTVSIYKDGARAGRLDNVLVRINDWATPRVHLDTDEANALNIKNGDTVMLIVS